MGLAPPSGVPCTPAKPPGRRRRTPGAAAPPSLLGASHASWHCSDLDLKRTTGRRRPGWPIWAAPSPARTRPASPPAAASRPHKRERLRMPPRRSAERPPPPADPPCPSPTPARRACRTPFAVQPQASPLWCHGVLATAAAPYAPSPCCHRRPRIARRGASAAERRYRSGALPLRKSGVACSALCAEARAIWGRGEGGVGLASVKP
jgi:hypothetical protein